VLNPFIAALEHASHAHDHGGAEPIVSELTTAVVSAGGGVLWGVLLGAGFGVAYFLVEPALPGGDRRAYVLAGAGFLTVSVGPWAVLPPVTPGAEALLGTRTRIAVYGAMMLVGALVAVASVLGYGRVSSNSGRPAGIVAAAAPLAVLAAVAVLSPSFVAGGEVAPELATAYRWTVVFGQAGLWALIATVFTRLDGVGGRGNTTDATAGYPAD